MEDGERALRELLPPAHAELLRLFTCIDHIYVFLRRTRLLPSLERLGSTYNTLFGGGGGGGGGGGALDMQQLRRLCGAAPSALHLRWIVPEDVRDAGVTTAHAHAAPPPPQLHLQFGAGFDGVSEAAKQRRRRCVLRGLLQHVALQHTLLAPPALAPSPSGHAALAAIGGCGEEEQRRQQHEEGEGEDDAEQTAVQLRTRTVGRN